MSESLLTVKDLHTQFATREGTIHAVDGLSFTVEQGEIVGIVGESGSGKSVTARSLIRLENPGRIAKGSIRFRDTEMTEADNQTIRRIRGDGMAMVFQNPTETLNPVFPVGEQIRESLKIHDESKPQRLTGYFNLPLFSTGGKTAQYRQRTIELMTEVGIPQAEERLSAYPHEFSGGMCQRAMLAIALAREPDLLIADEPTTALDVTIQAEILERLRELNEEHGMAILLITHDLGVIAELCDNVIVMYAGKVMEAGPTERVLKSPRHPYTEALLGCMPQNTPPKSPLNVIDGQVPSKTGESSGCPFAPRCGYATDECRSDPIPTDLIESGHVSNCAHVDKLVDTGVGD
jgi:peptide/nickel transport system ATP-binding protein